MNIIEQSWEWVQPPPTDVLQRIEKIGRVCYKSEDKIQAGSEQRFISMILKREHLTLLEHIVVTVKFVINRGSLLHLTRHRLASFTGESTRYCRYDDGSMTFIRPVWWDQWSEQARGTWLESMRQAEESYNLLLAQGSKPEQAREVLPNSLKVELYMTANLREWRHVFQLRAAQGAHTQIRTLMRECLEGFQKKIPMIFDNIITTS